MDRTQDNFETWTNPIFIWQYFSANRLAYFLITTIILLVNVRLFNKLKEWYSIKKRTLYLALKLPGPSALPLIGNALMFAGRSDEKLDIIRNLMSTFETPGRVWLGPRLFIMLSEPRDYETILGHHKASHKDAAYQFLAPFLGQGLITGSGPVHRAHRKAILPMLGNKTMCEYLKNFNAQSRICAEILEEKVGAGIFDLHPYITHCTFDINLDCILGMPGNSQKGGYKELVYWTEKAYEIVSSRITKPWLHADWMFSLSDLGKKHKIGQDLIHSFVESAVAQKKKERNAIEQDAIVSDKPRAVFLEQLVDCTAKTNLMNDVELRDEAYSMFTAGQDTTAIVCSFALLHIAANQKIQDKIREEISNILGDDENVSVEHLPKLVYTELVIKETVRLYPIAPLMTREATGDIELETCTLPKGCSILMTPFMTHRSTKYWTDPEKFIPERFLPENSRGRHPYAYIPFSSGLRSCVGKKFAFMCLKTIIVHVVRKFRMASPLNMEALRLKTDISIRSRDGYMVSIERV